MITLLTEISSLLTPHFSLFTPYFKSANSTTTERESAR